MNYLINDLFEESVDEINFNCYGDERKQLEGFLVRLRSIEKDMKAYKKRLDRLKSEISN